MATDQERAVWEAVKRLSDRVMQVDDVPRVSGIHPPEGTICVCARMKSTRFDDVADVEVWLSQEIVNDCDTVMAYLGGPMGIVASFEQEELARAEREAARS